MIRVVLALLLLVGTCSAGEIFPAGAVRDLDVGKYKEDIFRLVAKKMVIEIDPSMPFPEIVDMPVDVFNAELYMEGYLTTLTPYFKYTFPKYFPKANVINLPGKSWLEVLVHEAVHYFQCKYRPDAMHKGDGGTPNWIEEEAQEIQYWFRDKYVPEYWEQRG